MFESQMHNEVIFDAQQAFSLLKQGIVLLSINGPRTLFMAKEEMIRVVSDRAAYQLSHADFLDLYQNEQFASYEVDGFDPEAMKQKDDEYYQWKHK